MVNKPHYKKSKATETNNSHYENYTEHTKDKEDSPNIEDVDNFVKKIIYQKFNVFAFIEQGCSTNIEERVAI